MLDQLQTLAARYADMQRNIAETADAAALRRHIVSTLTRCLPAAFVTDDMVAHCFNAVHSLPLEVDPMHTGAIHAWAGVYLLTAADAQHPLLRRLHCSALRLLGERPATRDDLRLVTLDALYQPGLLPPGPETAFVRHRLGLCSPRLSCEEIALRMHKPLIYIHELESAILTTLSNGGPHA